MVEQLRGQGHLPLAAEPVGAGDGAVGRSRKWLRQPLFGQRPGAPARGRDHDPRARDAARCRPDRRPVAAHARSISPRARRCAACSPICCSGSRAAARSPMRSASTRRVFPRAYVSMVRAGEAGGALERRAGPARPVSRPGRAAGRAGALGAGLPDHPAGHGRPLDRGAADRRRAAVHAAVRKRGRRAAAADPRGDRGRRCRPALLVAAAARRWSPASGWCAGSFAGAESRARIDRWLLHVPLLGGLLVKVDTARLARTLGTLLANGVPLLNALAIARETLGERRRCATRSARPPPQSRRAAGLAEPLGRVRPVSRSSRSTCSRSARSPAISRRCC